GHQGASRHCRPRDGQETRGRSPEGVSPRPGLPGPGAEPRRSRSGTPPAQAMRTFLLGMVLGGSFLGVGFAQSPALPFLNRVLNEHDAQAGASGERLATGRFRLVDDPALYAVYEALQRQIEALDKVVDNEGDLILLDQYEGDLMGQMVE